MIRRHQAYVGVLAIALVCASVLALPTRSSAQAPGVRADIVSVSDAGYPMARAVVNLDDPEGTFSRGGPGEFSVLVDGKPASAVSADLASSQNVPLDILFVIDVSGSMAGAPLARTKEAASAFVAGLAPWDRVAILSFADKVVPVQDYTTDRAATRTAIEALVASGNTALYAATGGGAIKITNSPSARRAVILLSDGAQDGVPLTLTRDAAIGAAATAGAPWFTIGEGTEIDREYLGQLASVTRGRYLEAPDPNDLGALYASVGQLLRSQYIVTFDASATRAAGSQLEVRLTAGGQSSSAVTTYKLGPEFAPSAVTIEGVAAGERVSDTRAVTLAGAAGSAVRAAFYVDDVNVFETNTQPFTFNYDPRSFADGAHTLKVSVDYGGRSVESKVSFTSTPPAPAPSAGGGLPLLPILAVVGGLLVLLPVVLVLLRLRTMKRDGLLVSGRVEPWAKPIVTTPVGDAADGAEALQAPEEVGEPLGVLISRSGPDAGTEYTVGGQPVSIGSGARCGVRVADDVLAAEEARIWVSKGHLMVHKMTKLTTIVEMGTSGGWEILEPGDSVKVGDHAFEFRLLQQAPGSGEANTSAGAGDIARGPADAPAGGMPGAPQPRVASFSQLMPKNDFGPLD